MPQAGSHLNAVAAFSNNASAGDLMALAFDRPVSETNGTPLNGSMYYILIGNNGTLESGTILRLTRLANDPNHYSLTTGDFQLDETNNVLTIYSHDNDSHGVRRMHRVKLHDSAVRNRLRLEITEHSDKTKIGQINNVRIVNFDSLPDWAKDACEHHLWDALPPAEKRRLAAIRNAQDRLIRDMQERIYERMEESATVR